MSELPLTAASPLNAHCMGDRYVLREYSCPGCGTAYAVDVQPRDAPALPESRLG